MTATFQRDLQLTACYNNNLTGTGRCNITSTHVAHSVPARLGKGHGAKEIGHNLAREQPKFGHHLERE